MAKEQIAIIGAGFCGMASAWHLAQRTNTNIVIFDARPIGHSTSGIAAGLLHPYAGARSKLNWQAHEALKATLKLVNVAETALESKLFFHSGLIRPATLPQQLVDYAACASSCTDVDWLSAKECQGKVSGLASVPGIFIHQAYVIDCPKYLQGLWFACQRLGVRFEQRAIQSLSELEMYDSVIIAGGALSNTLPELTHIRMTQVKGQLLEIAWPRSHSNLAFPLASQTYLLMNSDGKTAIAGATYERGFANLEPDIEHALAEIIPKTQAFFPPIDRLMVTGCRAGVRASTPSRLPVLEHLGNGRWLFAGMGSKGLLYHAYFAEKLAAITTSQ